MVVIIVYAHRRHCFWRASPQSGERVLLLFGYLGHMFC